MHVKDLHKMANIVPIDIRRSYLQGLLCYRLIKLGSVELVENSRTRAADGPVVKQYSRPSLPQILKMLGKMSEEANNPRN